jgi:hypothetical protein
MNWMSCAAVNESGENPLQELKAPDDGILPAFIHNAKCLFLMFPPAFVPHHRRMGGSGEAIVHV